MRVKLLVGAVLFAASLHAARSYAEQAAPASPIAEPIPTPAALDFEAPVDLIPHEKADGLVEAIRRAERITAESGATRHTAAAPDFVIRIAALMRARADAIAGMAHHDTFPAAEAALHRTTIDLDRESEAALAEHDRP